MAGGSDRPLKKTLRTVYVRFRNHSRRQQPVQRRRPLQHTDDEGRLAAAIPNSLTGSFATTGGVPMPWVWVARMAPLGAMRSRADPVSGSGPGETRRGREWTADRARATQANIVVLVSGTRKAANEPLPGERRATELRRDKHHWPRAAGCHQWYPAEQQKAHLVGGWRKGGLVRRGPRVRLGGDPSRPLRGAEGRGVLPGTASCLAAGRSATERHGTTTLNRSPQIGLFLGLPILVRRSRRPSKRMDVGRGANAVATRLQTDRAGRPAPGRFSGARQSVRTVRKKHLRGTIRATWGVITSDTAPWPAASVHRQRRRRTGLPAARRP